MFAFANKDIDGHYRDRQWPPRAAALLDQTLNCFVEILVPPPAAPCGSGGRLCGSLD